jgi:hypothetical protein
MRGRWKDRLGIVVVLGALALLTLPASGSAAGWKVAQVPDGPVDAIFWGVSCPSTALCVAVGSNSTIASTTTPTGDGSAWKAVHPEGYLELPLGGGGAYPGNAIKGVSCPSTSLCVAAGPQGNIWASADPTGPVSSWVQAALGLGATHMNAISCASTALCVAVSQHGKVIWSTNPLGGAAAWTITELAEPFNLRGISCPTASLCVAVGNEGDILSSTNPTGGASAWSVARKPAGPGLLTGVSCPTTGLCVTANAGAMVTSTSPTSGAWNGVAGGTGLTVMGVSCPSTSACAAVDNNADAITSTNPTGGAAAWSSVNVIPVATAVHGNAFNGISCPTEKLCLAVGTNRQLIFSTEPFTSPAEPGAGRSKRPRVKIVAHPPQRVEEMKRRTRVNFRFRAIGKAVGFRCKLDEQRFKPCKSPTHYRLGRRKHVFKIRALAAGGKPGPVASFHFRIGPLLEPPPYVPCDPTQGSTPRKPCGGTR